MTGRLQQSLVHAVCRSAAVQIGESDGELLRRFVRLGDPSAFELIVWRHGAMVESVIARVLGRTADVDDAFQATFLALFQQSRSIRRQQALAGWLHRVALRIAHRMRRSSMQRWRREQAVARPDEVAGPSADAADLGPILHEEIDQLPDRFRLPFVSCQLEGRSVEEAANLLGVPRGTVLSRLARARDRLRMRLLRRGVTPAVAGLVLAESESRVAAALVAAAADTVFQVSQGGGAAPAVAGLAQGVIRDMILTKIKLTACTMLAVGTLGLGMVLVSQPTLRAEPDKKPAAKTSAGDLDQLQGKWEIVSAIDNGRDQAVSGAVVTIEGNQMSLPNVDGKDMTQLSIKLNPNATPSAIDLTKKGKRMKGIYELKNNTFKMCVCQSADGQRPTEFKADEDSRCFLLVLRREPTADDAKLGNDPKALREEIARLRQQLLVERDHARRIQQQLQQMQRVAEATRAEAQVARDLAEAQRAQAEAARREVEKVVEQLRKELNKKDPPKKDDKPQK